jgi:hypothetical protein
MNRKDFVDWTYDKFDRYGVRKPEDLTDEEIRKASPRVPPGFVDQYLRSRGKG